MTRVVNAYKEKPDVFIGRWTSAPRIREQWGEIDGLDGRYGNQHPVGQPCNLCRGPGGVRVVHQSGEESVTAFRETFLSRMADLDYFLNISALEGKTLGCLGEHEPCHGQVYVEWFTKDVRDV